MMKTDELITLLSQAPKPKKPVSLWVAISLFLVVCFTATSLFLGIRSDLSGHWQDITALYKTLLLFLNLCIVAWALDCAAQPYTERKINKTWPILLGLLFLLSLILEWRYEDAQQILHRLALPNFVVCLRTVSLYGTLGAIILTWLMHYYAPANERKAATLTGFAAASIGALGYSIHCPVDSPTFILISYGLPVLLITLCARYFATRFIRW